MRRTEEIAAKALAVVNDDRYKLALLVAKRAEAIANGTKPLCEQSTDGLKPADIALMEIAEGKVSIESFTPLQR